MKRAVDTDFNMDASPSLAPSENNTKTLSNSKRAKTKNQTMH